MVGVNGRDIDVSVTIVVLVMVMLMAMAMMVLMVMRQCQIRVWFESGVKKKILAASNQPLTSFFRCHDLPWSQSFQKMYDMYIVKVNG